ASQIAPERFSAIKGVHFVNGNRDKKALVSHILRYKDTGIKTEGTAVLDLEKRDYESLCVSGSERTRAYMKIEDGCESKCAYCIIPRARGKIVSRPLEECLEEARRLVRAGYKEIVLTGIEVSAYGEDLESADLALLLEKMEEIDGLCRIRLSSIDPSHLRPAFVDRIASLSKVAPHFHLSLQSCCDETLQRMRRRYNTAILKRNLSYLMEKLPDVRFTADVIVGFPGETEEEFEKTCAFIKELPLLHTHVFAYSPRPDTEAAAMPDQVDEQTKKQRSARLIAICEEVRDGLLQKEEGRIYPVLFEQYKKGVAYGHTPNFIEVALPADKAQDDLLYDVRLTHAKNGVVYSEKEENNV
ncbi:MAG: MiaB/RimO family radical SAM methylthiotransferase, partial [Clostridia bacterium]|nr:MiaB/RimO family radical SAM methylthiotransferase [Clostridia bacterium]